jgi:hypothetical protein
MSIENELTQMGYEFEYAYKDGNDRTEVWVNAQAGIAVRIEWLAVSTVVRP